MDFGFGTIAEASARAVCSMFVVMGVGVLFAYFKKIDKQGLSSVGNAINYLYVPAILFYSFARGLSVEILQSGAWILIVIGLVTIPVSALVAYPMMKLSRCPAWFSHWFLFGAVFQNTVALPLVLIQTICSSFVFPVTDPVTGLVMAPLNNASTIRPLSNIECIAKSQTYLFLYIFMHGLVFWIVAYDLMPAAIKQLGSSREQEENPVVLEEGVAEIHLDDVIVVASPSPPSPPLPPPPFLKRWRSVAAVSFYGGTVGPEFECIARGKFVGNYFVRCGFHVLSLFLRPPIIAQFLGTLVGLVPALKMALFAPLAVLEPVTISIKIFAEASTAVTNLSMSASLGLEIFKLSHWTLIFGGSPEGLSVRSTWVFVLTRMFVIPGVLFGLLFGGCVLNWIPKDPLLRVIAFMVSATPSANMCVVVPQILGNHEASGAMGLLILGQYLVALPSLLLWLSLAFYLTEQASHYS